MDLTAETAEIKMVEQANGARLISGPAVLVRKGAPVTVTDLDGSKVTGKVLAILKSGDKNGIPWALASFARNSHKTATWGDDPQGNESYWLQHTGR